MWLCAEGSGGGATLAKPAGRITLADVYGAVEGEVDLFATPRSDPNPLCPVGRCVQDVLKERTERVESAVERELKKTTIADVLADVRSAGRQ